MITGYHCGGPVRCDRPRDQTVCLPDRDTHAACAGQILVMRLMQRGVARLVGDGGIRDAGPIGAMPFPVFCGGPSAPLNLARHHAVESNVQSGAAVSRSIQAISSWVISMGWL